MGHTGEVEVELEAPSFGELLAEAGRALGELMLGEEGASGQQVHETVVVEGSDRAQLLVAWLDELVFRSEINRAVFTRFEISALDDRKVRADIYGVSEPVLKTAVKAATYHRLLVTEQKALAERGGVSEQSGVSEQDKVTEQAGVREKAGSRWLARVVLDV